MLKKIIKINQDKCLGCGLCISACQESALGFFGGKAALLREDHCDGLGRCLPACPAGAISFEEKELPNSAALTDKTRQANASGYAFASENLGGCPGVYAKTLQTSRASPLGAASGPTASALRQWPVQIKLAPLTAAHYHNANLLIAADCAAYAHASFHRDFMHNKITLIGCPKLDAVDYSEKLSAIMSANNLSSITVVRMQVPCCSGLEKALLGALRETKKELPCQIVQLSISGEVLDEEYL